MSTITSHPRPVPVVDDQAMVFPLTVEQYRQLMELGVIVEGDPYELLDGQVIRKLRNAEGEDPMTIGNYHVWVVTTLGRVGRKLERHGCYMRLQSPVSLPPYNEPEPDGAIVRGDKDAYRERTPTAADTLCVIEVADASLRRDRGVKQKIYANAGIPLYVIVNLPDRVIEVYTRPMKDRYADRETLSPGQKVSFPTAAGVVVAVPVRQLLP
jgi:Uma2 family endonuclease